MWHPEGMQDVRLTVAQDEIEADMVCGVLREHGIACAHRRVNVSGLDWGAINIGAAGMREVLVAESTLDEARALLDTRPEMPADAGAGQPGPEGPAAASDQVGADPGGQVASGQGEMPRRSPVVRGLWIAALVLIFVVPSVLAWLGRLPAGSGS